MYSLSSGTSEILGSQPAINSPFRMVPPLLSASSLFLHQFSMSGLQELHGKAASEWWDTGGNRIWSVWDETCLSLWAPSSIRVHLLSWMIVLRNIWGAVYGRGLGRAWNARSHCALELKAASRLKFDLEDSLNWETYILIYKRSYTTMDLPFKMHRTNQTGGKVTSNGWDVY